MTFTEGRGIRKNLANLQCQLYKKVILKAHNYHRTFPMRVRRNSEADYNLKVRTTLIIHEGGKKSKKKRSKQAELLYNSLFVPSIFATYSDKNPQIGTRGKQQ